MASPNCFPIPIFKVKIDFFYFIFIHNKSIYLVLGVTTFSIQSFSWDNWKDYSLSDGRFESSYFFVSMDLSNMIDNIDKTSENKRNEKTSSFDWNC